MKEYVVYKGDSLICIGTDVECAAHMKISVKSFYWYKTPSGRKRLGKLDIEELEEEEE